MTESEEKLLEMIRQRNEGMEQKGLSVNMGQTKVMKCKVRQAENSGKISMYNLHKRCWKKLDLLHNMQEVDSKKDVEGFEVDSR